jgi:hypothetical protein
MAVPLPLEQRRPRLLPLEPASVPTTTTTTATAAATTTTATAATTTTTTTDLRRVPTAIGRELYRYIYYSAECVPCAI